jgi:hypothetical protein
MPLDTPVVLFIFNRPDTTRRVFETIRQARPTRLLVVSDGPRDRPGEAALCAETRSILNTIDWECDLRTNFSETNLGVPRRFASAFEWIFGLVDEAIILEHDCLPHPEFFSYCAQLLRHYRADPRVMWIGGTNPITDRFGDGSYFFARSTWVWGWATWKRAWQHFDISVRDYSAFRRSGQIARISPHRRLQRGYMALLELAYAGQWINWDVQATFTVWKKDGICIVPNGNLISNIGFGDRAENTRSEDDPLANLPFRALGPLIHPSDRSVQQDYDIRVFDAYASWMTDYARQVRYSKLPLYGTAKRLAGFFLRQGEPAGVKLRNPTLLQP